MPDENNVFWVIGVDLSLNSTGLYSVDAQGAAQGSVINPKKLRGVGRLSFVREAVLAYSEGLGYEGKPDLVVIEGYSMGSRGKVFDIGELGGIIKLMYYTMNIPMLIVPPKTLKMFAVGNGNADKDQMIEWAISKGYEPSKSDDADAFALYSLGRAYLNGNARSERRRQIYNACLEIK